MKQRFVKFSKTIVAELLNIFTGWLILNDIFSFKLEINRIQVSQQNLELTIFTDDTNPRLPPPPTKKTFPPFHTIILRACYHLSESYPPLFQLTWPYIYLGHENPCHPVDCKRHPTPKESTHTHTHTRR